MHPMISKHFRSSGKDCKTNKLILLQTFKLVNDEVKSSTIVLFKVYHPCPELIITNARF